MAAAHDETLPVGLGVGEQERRGVAGGFVCRGVGGPRGAHPLVRQLRDVTAAFVKLGRGEPEGNQRERER